MKMTAVIRQSTRERVTCVNSTRGGGLTEEGGGERRGSEAGRDGGRNTTTVQPNQADRRRSDRKPKAVWLNAGSEISDRLLEPLLEREGAIDRANYYGTVRPSSRPPPVGLCPPAELPGAFLPAFCAFCEALPALTTRRGAAHAW